MKARLLVTTAIVVSVTACSSPGSGSAPGSATAPDYSHPFMHERQVTVAQAETTAGFRVVMPNSTAASTKTLDKVWVSSTLHQVALVFDHGNVTVMMWPAIYHNPEAFFRKSMAGMSGKDEITHVNGVPMLVTFPHTDPTGKNPAWVEFDLHSVDTNIVSRTYGTTTLLAIAKSMT